MKKINILLIIVLSFILTGCNNYNDINDTGIINSIGIEKNNNNYIISVNMLIPTKDNVNNKTVYKVESNNIDNAFDKLYLTSTKQINLSHLELLLLSNKLNKTDYNNIINLFIKRSDSRNTFNVVLVKNYNSNEIFKYTNNEIISLIKANSKEDGIVSNITFDNMTTDILNLNIAYLPTIEINNSINILGYSSIYKENKLLSEKESVSYSFITNKINKCNLVTDDLSIKVKESNTTINIDESLIKINIKSIIDKDKDKYIKILKEYIEYFISNNNQEYFKNLIKKYNYNYYKNNKIINLKYKINISTGEYYE